MAEQTQSVTKKLRRLVKRLLHAPTVNLRRHRGVRENVYRVLHEILTQEIPHPKGRSEEDDVEGQR